MQVTEITVSAGRVVSHPVESYSNLKPMVSLKAVLTDGDDYEASVKELQAKAEQLVDDHANALKKHIRDMYYLGEKEREAKRLEQNIIESQKRLEAVRSEIPLMLESSNDEEFEPVIKTNESDW